MKKTTALVLLIVFSFFTESYAQALNDYRSIGNGNWTNISVWEIYNGSAWVAATTYPGQIPGTNDVSIIGGDSITLSSNITNSLNSLTVGDAVGATDTLLISATSSLNTLLITINNGGFMSWTSNVSFSLPAGAAILIIPSGSIDTSTPCSASKRIVIGTTIYSTCNGGAGAEFSFSELNAGGGSLSISPTSNTPICEGESLILFANPSGTGSASASISWTGTGPGGYTFNSTTENPIITGLISGTYTFSATIVSGAISNTNSIIVVIVESPNAPISGGDEIICIGTLIPTLTATVNTGETVDWYDAATTGNLLTSSNTSFTPTTAGSFYAEARSTSSNCTSPNRTEIIITARSCRVITNRRITYRVSP